ncbi:MAG: glycosyltransferase family 2 protein [Candidatus Bathyarchaeia archaeon]
MNKSLNRNFVKGDLQYASSTQSIIGALVENETITPRQVQKKVLRRAPSTQVVIAALNEEKGIGLTISELNHTLKCPKILVVDGKSTDRTVEEAKNMGAHVVLQDGLGKGDAIAKAIENLDLTVDYVVITDADYTYPAEYVPKMIQVLEANPDVGMVCGSRLSGYADLTGSNRVFYFGNRLIAFAHNFFNGIQLADPLTGLRVVRAEILRNWKVKSKGFDVEVELNHHVTCEGFAIAEVPIKYRERLGEKKLGFKNGAEILKRIMLEAQF